MRTNLTAVVLLSSIVFLQAQDFDIRRVQLTQNEIILNYDLDDTLTNRVYSIWLYTSHDNFIAPVGKVTGDVGLKVRPGKNKRIVWQAREELGAAFKGDVTLEVRGKLYVPFINFEGFEGIEVRKRTVPFTVKWSGGTRQNVLNFQLYDKNDKLVYVFPNVGNEFEYKVVIPTSVKPGKDYYFRISDSRNKDQVVITPTFTIKRRIPLALKAIPVVAIGSAIYFIAKPDDSGPNVSSPPNFPDEK